MRGATIAFALVVGLLADRSGLYFTWGLAAATIFFLLVADLVTTRPGERG